MMSERGQESLQLILDRLSTLDWFCVTGEEGTDPEAVESYAAGLAGRTRERVYVLCRYVQGDPFCLVSMEWIDGIAKNLRVPASQDQLQSLWDQIAKSDFVP